MRRPGRRGGKPPGRATTRRLAGKVAIARQHTSASGDRYKGGTILDPADGKIYKAEVWAEDGKLKVRGYLGVLYKTQTWLKGN